MGMEFKDPSQAVDKKMEEGKKARAAKFAKLDNEAKEAMESGEESGKQKEASREEKREDILKKMEARGGGKWADNVREKEKRKKMGEADETGDLELADKMGREKRISKEEMKRKEVIKKEEKEEIRKNFKDGYIKYFDVIPIEDGIYGVVLPGLKIKTGDHAGGYMGYSIKFFDTEAEAKRQRSKYGFKEKNEEGANSEVESEKENVSDEVAELELADKFEKETKEEVSPEGKEKEKKESSDEKLEALSEELRKAREEYIKKDYEIDKKANIIYKALKIEGLKKLGLGNARDEVEEYKNNYEKALKNYKDAVIDSEYVKDKEDIEVATRGFVVGENLNRESIRTDLEAGETGWSKILMKGFNGLTEKYRKLSFKQKLLIGAGAAGAGLGLSVAGGVAAAGGMVALGKVITSGGMLTVGGYRAFTMGVSSAGFSSMFETIAQKGKSKKEEKEIERIKDSRFEGSESDIELSYEKLKEALDKNIENVDSKIQKEKQWKVWRKYIGAGAGISMSMAGRYLGKEIAEYFGGEAPEVSDGAVGESGAPEVAKGSFSEEIARGEKLAGSGEGGPWSDALEKMREDGMPKAEDIVKVPENLEVPENVSLGVAKGSSLEGTLKTFLAANSEKLTEGNMGWDADKYSSVEEWAGKRAHIIAEEYAKANADQFPKGAPSLIHPGAEINLDLSNPANIQIDNINDPEELGYLGDKVGEKASEAADAKATEAVAETVAKQAEAPVAEAARMEASVETMSDIEMQNQQLAEMKIAHALGLNPNEYSAINDTSVSKLLSEMDKFQELGPEKYKPDLPSDGIYGNPERYKHLGLAEFIKSQLNNVPEGDHLSVKEFLMKVDLESLPKDSVIIAKDVDPMYLVEVLQQETAETIKICANNNIEDWNNIKNVPVVDSGFNKIVENIKAAVSKVLPEGVAAPSEGDTVEKWMTRITNEAYKRGTLDELREQLQKLKVKS